MEFRNRILPIDYDKSIPQLKQIYNAKWDDIRRKLILNFFIKFLNYYFHLLRSFKALKMKMKLDFGS